jgi:hypothetical protein
MEQITVAEDGQSAEITGRTLKPLSKKLNPVWWFQNEDEQNLTEAPWFMPDSAQWYRQLRWELRNPLQNFRCYVVGVQDRNYRVTGKAPVMSVQRDDLDPPETGFQWCWLRLTIPLPFISYSGKGWQGYAGWQPSGFFGFKLDV